MGDEERIRVLLERGAERGKRNTAGYTAEEWGREFWDKELF
jgi:hypothetical protein